MPGRRCLPWVTARFPIWSRSGTSSVISSVTDAGRRTNVPSKPKRPCSSPGCPKLTHGRFCEEHAKKEAQRYEKYDRDPAVRRRYGRAWKRIRDRYAEAHPLCELCQQNGKLTPTEEIHHKLPLSEGGTHATENLIALCKSCHAKLHAERGDRWHNR
jgi:HNH endonuclease domain protein